MTLLQRKRDHNTAPAPPAASWICSGRVVLVLAIVLGGVTVAVLVLFPQPLKDDKSRPNASVQSPKSTLFSAIANKERNAAHFAGLKAEDVQDPKTPRWQDRARTSGREDVRHTAGRITINGTLPSLEGLAIDSNIRKAWETALRDLKAEARIQISKWIMEAEEPIQVQPGIPGTGIDTDEEARAVQQYLDCVASDGEWVHDASGTWLAQANSSLPVHKQSAALASCDRTFYRNKDRPVLVDEWDVRSSLKWHWKPAATCIPPSARAHKLGQPQVDEAPARPPSRQALCHYLRNKHILMVGDAPSHYLLHDLLLDWTSDKPLTCYGDLYCKEHGICGGSLAEERQIGSSWIGDTQVYDRLPGPNVDTGPLPHNSDILRETHRASSTDDASVAERAAMKNKTWGTILRYRRSDSMYLNQSPSHPRHQPAFIHPITGIRDVNMYAVPDSRRSDIVILSKAPIPVPRPSEAGDASSSATQRKIHDLMASCSRKPWAGEEQAVNAIRLAAALTKEVWLPELLESLRALRVPPAPQDSLLVYRGQWRMQPACASGSSLDNLSSDDIDNDDRKDGFEWKYIGDGPPPLASYPSLKSLLFPSSTYESKLEKATRLTDMHSLLFNLQAILQNTIVRHDILPKLGIVFLDLESATSIWRSGFVGSARVKGPKGKPKQRSNAKHGERQQQQQQQQRVMQSSKSLQGQGPDCLRMCLPSPGLALEEFFVGALNRLFQEGFSSQGRAATWLGSGFVPVRERTKRKLRSGNTEAT